MFKRNHVSYPYTAGISKTHISSRLAMEAYIITDRSIPLHRIDDGSRSDFHNEQWPTFTATALAEAGPLPNGNTIFTISFVHN